MEHSEDYPVLIMQSGPMQGQRWSITIAGVTVGRDETCDVYIPDRQISRHHFRVVRKGKATWIEDLKSKNGTWVNGTPIAEEQELKDGDLIQIAFSLQMIYLASESTVPLQFDGTLPQKGRIRLDSACHSVLMDEKEIQPPLSVHQYRFLELLFKRGGGIATRDDIIDYVWPGEDTTGITDQAIDALVRRLRERLKEVDPDHEYILTIRGHGFRLQNSF
jgi:pSer/pThr/pTyr-binding forkhead associated (FHA) protein